MELKAIPFAAVLGVILGGTVFFGVPLWLGFAGHAPGWIVAWTFVTAPFSPSGFGLIDDCRMRSRPWLTQSLILRALTIPARIGAIGLLLFEVGRLGA